jgi:hypothetical protein
MARSNPYALAKNGIKLNYPLATDETILYPNISYVVAADGSTTDVEILNDSGSTYITVKITDKKNNSVTEQFKPVSTGDTATIDTSSLDNGCGWVLRVYAGVDPSSRGCDGAELNYCLEEICDPKGASGDTVPAGLQGVWPFLTDDSSTVINWDETKALQYNETYDLGAYAAGDDLALLVDLFGTDAATQDVALPTGYKTFAFTATGDVTSSTPVTFPADNTVQQIAALVLDITAPGSYSADITFTSNDNAYEVYKFTLTWTAA